MAAPRHNTLSVKHSTGVLIDSGTSADRCPERMLACEVLNVALADLSSVTENSREAQHFCLSASGGWAKARRFWCDLAGVEESRYHEAAIRINTTVVAKKNVHNA